jgi:pimeloyl-ACP methyl ester carboxylesterase
MSDTVARTPSPERSLRRRVGRVALLAVGSILGLAVAALGGGLMMRDFLQQANREIGLIVSETGVQEAGFVEIGGIRQWITATGQDRRAPVLVYLHGGPGSPTSDIAYAFQRPWEDYFVVVQWDQRGAGRSGIDREKLAGTITREQLVADSIEVIEYARRHFGQEKVILVGSSNGTTLGLEVAKRRPDLVSLFVGVGQQTGWDAWYYEETRQLTLAEAIRARDSAQADRIRAVGPPRAFADAADYNAWTLAVQRELHVQGHGWRNARGQPDWNSRAIAIALGSPTL